MVGSDHASYVDINVVMYILKPMYTFIVNY